MSLRSLEQKLSPGHRRDGVVVPDVDTRKFAFRPKPSKEEVKSMLAGDPRRHFINHANNHGRDFAQPPRIATQMVEGWEFDRLNSSGRIWEQTQIKYREHGGLFPEVSDRHAEAFAKKMAARKHKELTPSLAAIKKLGLVAAGSRPGSTEKDPVAVAPTRGQMKQLTRILLGQPHLDMPRLSPRVKGKLRKARSAVQFWTGAGFHGDQDEELEQAQGLLAPAKTSSTPSLPKARDATVKHLRAWAGPDRSFSGRGTLRETTPWRETDENRRVTVRERDLRLRRAAEHAAALRMSRTF